MQQTIRRKPVGSSVSKSPLLGKNDVTVEVKPGVAEIANEKSICEATVTEISSEPSDFPKSLSDGFYDHRKYIVADSAHPAERKDHGSPELLTSSVSESFPDLDGQFEKLTLQTEEDFANFWANQEPDLDTMLMADGLNKRQRLENRTKHALGEAKHYAGDLLAHPHQATKHYSILRHSSWLVYYSGPSTSIAITIFSDRDLPPSATLWLQRRGFSGNIGMKIKAARTARSSWINVTPELDSSADLLPADDERAWQRDITKFLNKAKSHKTLGKHRPYETNVVRIPHAAEDGYFRLVLCDGRKVLCPSPVFRYASTKLDPSILRGASIVSMPLEIGVKVGSFVARQSANAALGGLLQPITSTVQNLTAPFQLDGLTQWAATEVYDVSGAADRVDSAIDKSNEEYDKERTMEFSAAMDDTAGAGQVVGSEGGPELPYPIRMSGRVAPDPHDGSAHLRDRPTVGLTGVDESTVFRLSGAYMGWALVHRPSGDSSFEAADEDVIYDKWHQAVILVSTRHQVSVVQQKDTTLHICHSLDVKTIFKTKIDIMIMGLLHPPPSEAETPDEFLAAQNIQHQLLDDVATTNRSLSRPAWSPDAVLELVRTRSPERSFMQRVGDARAAAQKTADKVPIHMLGVRTHSGALKDGLIGRGGIRVRR